MALERRLRADSDLALIQSECAGETPGRLLSTRPLALTALSVRTPGRLPAVEVRVAAGNAPGRRVSVIAAERLEKNDNRLTILVSH